MVVLGVGSGNSVRDCVLVAVLAVVGAFFVGLHILSCVFAFECICVHIPSYHHQYYH